MTPKMIPPILPGDDFLSLASSREPGGVSTGVAIGKTALKIKMSAWVYGRGELRTVYYRAMKDVFFSRKLEGEGRQARRDGVLNRDKSPASVYNYRSLPGVRGEAMIQPLEGCVHEDLRTMAQRCDRRGRRNSAQFGSTGIGRQLHDLRPWQ